MDMLSNDNNTISYFISDSEEDLSDFDYNSNNSSYPIAINNYQSHSENDCENEYEYKNRDYEETESSEFIPSQTPPDPFNYIESRSRLKWQEDSHVSHCSNCNYEFNFYYRRHHCRCCGSIFCGSCSNCWATIPECITHLPTNNGITENIDREKKYRLCDKCDEKVEYIKRLEVMLKVFQLVDLDIKDLKNMAGVCKLWRQLASFYLSKFREIQYKLPYQKYTEWEKNVLWANRHYLQNHDIWSVHLLRSHHNDSERLPEIFTICTNLTDDINTNKNVSACWNRMCTRVCQPQLSRETAMLILDIMDDDETEKETSKLLTTIDPTKDLRTDALKLVVKAFEQCSDDEFEIYLPYLVDKMIRLKHSDILSLFVLFRSRFSIRIANSTYWLLKTASYEFPKKAASIIHNFNKYLPEEFLAQIEDIKTFTTGVEKNYKISKPTKLTNWLDKRQQTISPCFPELGKFLIRSGSVSIKDSATKPVQIPLQSSIGEIKNILYKREDIRKDMIVVNCIIRLMKTILKDTLGFDCNIVTYDVLPTSPDSGFIAMVDKCNTLFDITEEKGQSILNYIIDKNPDESINKLRQRFIRSCAAYTVITFLLSVNDRHLDNILLTDRGELFHIDYGFILGQNTKNPIKTPCMRITSGMLEALGGYNSDSYREFNELCCQIYDVLRKHVNIFVCLLSLLPKHKNIKTWSSPYISEKRVIREIVKRFAPGENYEEAKTLLQTRIMNSTNTSSLSKYHVVDFFHRHSKRKTISNVFTYTISSTMSGTKNLLGGIWKYLSGS